MLLWVKYGKVILEKPHFSAKVDYVYLGSLTKLRSSCDDIFCFSQQDDFPSPPSLSLSHYCIPPNLLFII